jgi:hypothetical protein
VLVKYIVYYVEFEVMTARVMRSFVCWDITYCSPLKVSPRFGGTCRLHLQSWRVSQARNQHEAARKKKSLFQANFFLVLLFDPEDRGDIFLRIIVWHSTDYMPLYPKDRTVQAVPCTMYKIFSPVSPHQTVTPNPSYREDYIMSTRWGSKSP